MPALCDINFLAPLCYAHHQHYPLALNWLEQHDVPRAFAVCRMSQLGLLRLLCTQAVMHEDTLSTAEAWRVYDALMHDDRFVFALEPPGLDAALRRFTSRRAPVTGLWTDAYLAAFALAAGLQFVTFDRAFRNFTNLDLVLLGDTNP
ncbi:MAG: type II toxin-antitoxin system VapC family toxin [Chloroflexi bacterium]|nr:type II toxin-antitoxin system VapC family toxin [Chloroflexota bacterium]